MRIIPVIDLLRGAVVRGIGGRREEYRPVQSQLCQNSTPAAVANALAACGFGQVYMADLDAIAGAEPAWEDYAAVAAAGLDLLLDAGLETLERASKLAELSYAGRNPVQLVAGLESLPRPALLAEIVRLVGAERTIFSLDLKSGRPLNRCAAWQSLSPAEIAGQAVAAGVRRMILLDLARVGENCGAGTEELAAELRGRFPELTLIGGGGVRSLADLPALERAGFDAALVASALHDGRITAADLRAAGVLA